MIVSFLYDFLNINVFICKVREEDGRVGFNDFYIFSFEM